MSACTSTAPTGTPPPEGVNPKSAGFYFGRLKVPCELEAGHHDLHRSGPLVWHDPPLILAGGEEVTNDDSDHWREGEVVFSWEHRGSLAHRFLSEMIEAAGAPGGLAG